MTDKQLAAYLSQLHERFSTAMKPVRSALFDDEKYIAKEKGFLGEFDNVPILDPLEDFETHLEDTVRLLAGTEGDQ